jgi:ABC-type branched-subunit amino acid transport system substrate-binding protein
MAPFTGPAKELGQNMKRGIEAAFNVANAKGNTMCNCSKRGTSQSKP